MNTGNRGPIEHQPGDWVCLKCDYLNWRRRKVCGSCFPYAEGNLDGVSASVQAERVALLTSVLVAQQQQQQQQQAQQNQQTNQVQSVGLLHSYPSSTYDPLQMQVQLSMHAPSSSPSSTPAYDERIYFPYASGVGVSGGSAGSPDLSLLQQQLQHSHQQPHHHQQGQTQISSIASSSHHASSSTSTAASTSVSNSASSASASVIHQSLPHLAQDRQSERDWDRDASASAIHSRANLAVAGGNNGVGANSNLHLHGAEQYYGGVINFAGASSAALSGVSVGASQAQAQRTLSRSSSLADLVAANVASNVNVNGAANGPSGSTGSVSNSPSSFGWNNSPTRSTTSGSASGHGSGQLRTKSSLSSMKSMTSSSQFVVGTPPPFPQLQFNAFRERDAHSPPNANAAPGSHGPLLPSFFADVLQSPFSSPRGLRGSSIEESDEDEVEHGRGFSGDWMKSDDFNSSSLIGASSAASMGLKEDELDDVVYPSSRSSRRTSSHLSLSLSGELKDLHDGAEKIVWNGRRDVGNRAVGEEWSDSGSGSRGGSRGGSRRGSQENLNGKNKDLEKDLKEAIGAIGELTMGRK
ncbi:hypothetical protein SISSUDRAFT_260780 [Sistotremastrum suecicum HHB10207 ss-3]|uniref:RanBP2-type domain-containing protein n=1 Tax=Sistotremastrum suecicum HHB10207 ss-3 TaxID=1314776 RepID=A0A166GDN7_9AGAM|nr:hypothetical protein SISSUDRAFT_260780 [Sistotremastrum suecicum HHB10207 ss-3]